MTGLAIVGAGYVADFYGATLPNHADLRLVGVFDWDPDRSRIFAQRYGARVYGDLAELLADPAVAIVANLTNPRSHHEVSRACLEAGKHVYSEKPLGMTLDEAQSLSDLARSRNLRLGAAPCNMLGEAFEALRRMVEKGTIGKVRLAYAEMDDGMVHKLRFRHWRNSLGIAWPAVDEFEIGCTFEHAGYQLALLAALFGPARRLTSFASCQVPRKAPDLHDAPDGPDFSVGLLEYDDSVVARLTCSVLAPENRSLTIVGEDGWLILPEVWDYHAPILHGRWHRSLPARILSRFVHLRHEKRIRVPGSGRHHWSKGHRMDFARGIAVLARSIADGTPSDLDADVATHIVEVTDLLQRGTPGTRHVLASTFERRLRCQA